MSKIKDINKLEVELKKVYNRTEPTVVQEYIEYTDSSTDSPAVVHQVSGCCDCVFVKQVNEITVEPHSFCIWDGSMSNIDEYIQQDSVTPKNCPLQNSNIRVQLKDNNNGNDKQNQ